jgi:hypothetical protein
MKKLTAGLLGLVLLSLLTVKVAFASHDMACCKRPAMECCEKNLAMECCK